MKYVGARYMPKFLGAYDATANYQALSVVDDGMGSTYVSNQPTPAGTPLTDTDYWALYGVSSGAILNLQNQIDALNDYKTAMVAIVTPEMYGAIGDGNVDDYQAIMDALTAGSICICAAHYRTTTSIQIPSDKTLIVNGKIDYDGPDCAIKLTNRRTKIDGLGVIESNGDYGIEITSARHEIRNVSVQVTGNYTAAIKLEAASNAASIAYIEMENVKMYGRDQNNNYGIGLYIHTDTDGFCNENTYSKVVPAYFVDALRIFNESSNSINRNKFIQFDGEGCDRSLYAYSGTSANIQDNYFDFRIEEFGNTARIYVDGRVRRNKFVGMGFAPKNFDVINPGTKALYTGGLGTHNIIEGWILTDSGASFGYNGSFHLNGDVVVFDANSQRDSILAMSGDEVLTRATSVLWPNKIIATAANATYLNLDLNYVSDWCSSPLEYLYVANPSGVTVSIINDNITLFPATLLAQGYYKVIYNISHDAIVLEKITLA